MARNKLIFTIGHSTRPTREFIKTLKSYEIKLLVDVRHYPGSRHCPQFGKATLKRNLLRHGIEYVHLLNLGGRRKILRDAEENMGWRSLQFRGYADYMQTAQFQEGLKDLMALAKEQRVAIMCSEAVPWRCHRSMIADALLVHKFKVLDIFTQTSVRPHELTSFARVKGKKITYPAEP